MQQDTILNIDNGEWKKKNDVLFRIYSPKAKVQEFFSFSYIVPIRFNVFKRNNWVAFKPQTLYKFSSDSW